MGDYNDINDTFTFAKKDATIITTSSSMHCHECSFQQCTLSGQLWSSLFIVGRCGVGGVAKRDERYTAGDESRGAQVNSNDGQRSNRWRSSYKVAAMFFWV